MPVTAFFSTLRVRTKISFFVFVLRSFFAFFAFVAARAGATAARRGRLDSAARLGPSPRRTQKLKKGDKKWIAAKISGRGENLGARRKSRDAAKISGRGENLGTRRKSRDAAKKSFPGDPFYLIPYDGYKIETLISSPTIPWDLSRASARPHVYQLIVVRRGP